MMVGVAIGLYKDLYAAKEAFVKEAKTITPNPENSKKYQKYYNEYKKIYSSVRNIMEAADHE